MIREIGSEFWNVPVNEHCKSLFPESSQWYLSGRSALYAVIADLKEKKECHTVALPSWCCDSMIKPFIDSDFEVKFYPVYWDDGLIQDVRTDCDVLYLMDYFGYSSCKFTDFDLKKYKGSVICDVTHSFFSSCYSDADYYFGSLRKWCGVWTGGYAWTNDDHRLITVSSANDEYTGMRMKAMELKKSYINDTVIKDKPFLSIFNEAEELLESIGIAPAAERDISLAEHLDADMIISRRRANAGILHSAFHDWLMFPEMKDTDCPLFVPVQIPNGRRDDLRRHLIKSNIYCPVHWPISEYHKIGKKEKEIYQNELSLVCDQRYTKDDMKRMVDCIKEFWKEA